MVTSTQAETITTARIRGIGTVGDNFGLESSVGVYIDGVFRARNGVGFGDLGELERIEVLRGPQGTLFGKNTSAGVLNIVTAAPEFDHRFGAEVTIGDYEYQRLSAFATGPLIEDQLAYRLFAVDGQRGGFSELVIRDANGTRVEESETQNYNSIRGQLLWTPSSTVEGRIIADYTDREELCCSAVTYDYTAAALGLVQLAGGDAAFPADPDDRVAFANRPYIQNVEDWGLSAEFDIDLPIGTLTSVTAFRNWTNNRSQDIDYTSADLAFRDNESNFTDLERFSQEIRLTGQTERLDWLVGAFMSHEDLRLGDALRFGEDWEPFLSNALSIAGGGGPNPGFVAGTLNAVAGAPLFTPGWVIPGGTGPIQDLYSQTATSWAVFTHNTYALTDELRVTFGLRYTEENKDVYADFSTNSPAGCAFLEQAFGFDPVTTAAGSPATAPLIPVIARVCLPYARSGLDANGYDRERSDEELSGTLRLTYDLTDDSILYAGYSRGFKSGGFNLDRQFNGPIDATGYTSSNSAFPAEIIDSYEVGFKSQLFGDVFLLNGNLFHQIVDDFQLNTFNGLAFVVESIDESTSTGVEIDLAYATPIPGLDISGGYAYVDSEYTDVNTGDPLIDAIEGGNFSLSPEHFLTAQLQYERPIFERFVARFSLDGRWVSDYNTGSDLDPEKEQEAFGLLNMRVGIGGEEGGWAVEVWGRNLTDETYAQVAFDSFAQGGRVDANGDGAGTRLEPRGTQGYHAFLGAPRTWGVTLRTEW
jgi:outer membrane receptor protein involved in Fe transport